MSDLMSPNLKEVPRMKTCIDCKELLDYVSFSKRKRVKKNGDPMYSSVCKRCNVARSIAQQKRTLKRTAPVDPKWLVRGLVSDISGVSPFDM